MSWQTQLRGDSLAWLLEPDSPGVRYLALRDLVGLSHEDAELNSARRKAHKEGPITEVLAHMEHTGYWVKAGPGYNPKYRSTVWAIILLAQLGASAQDDKRIEQACRYLTEHNLTEGGQFTALNSGAPSGTVDCLQGNLCWSLMELGYDHPHLRSAYEWMARTVTGDGIASKEERDAPIRYYAYKCGPVFACGVNEGLSCAWGGCKVLLAFGKWNANRRTPLIRKAIKMGVDFFFGIDPVTAEYPGGNTGKPSPNWWKFGFPVFYVSDILQIAEALAGLGYGRDRRLGNTIEFIRRKQNEQGRWLLDYDYSGKTWVDFGAKKTPNKWVTLRALRVLKAAA
ncbi:MAG: nitrogen fixation protein NifH [Chloroflexi bacterium]|nr:nitrogen fixation protein NifH [Chloroflexota bacterium]MDL1942094.1 nitrogen fixation protein NifH [Chloroflexi bacterium CFX2]